MKIVIIDTYYRAFLNHYYKLEPTRATGSYAKQHRELIDACFGTSDFHSLYLTQMGHPTYDLLVSAVPLQTTWASENGVSFSRLALGVPLRAFRLPVVGPWLASLPGLVDIAVAQVEAAKPDVLYCQDLSFFPPETIARLRRSVRLVVGQNASPLPPENFLRSYDLILTSFPHAVPRLRSLGIGSEYFRLAFEPRVLDRLGPAAKDMGATFVGGISRHHGKALSTLEYLAANTPIEFFGYGAERLDSTSSIKTKHHGEVWGLEMYRALARSRVTLNRHIDTAENNANNMRLYEATGVGTMLITDRKDNLQELFDVGKEVVAYSSPEEAAELIRYYLDHPDEAAAIAQAGQARTLREHTFEARMRELVPVLERYLDTKTR